MKVIMIGGGIGGLTAAIALRRQGIDAEIYERSTMLKEVGAGISLWPNAVKALEELGFAEHLRSISLKNASVAIRRSSGAVISHTPAQALEQRFGGGVLIVRRAELLDMLATSFGDEHIHLGYTCSGIEETDGIVTARFSNGESASSDVLVGADGLRSVVRRYIGHSEQPRYSGYTAWRSIVQFDSSSIVPAETWGQGKRFGIFPTRDGAVYWYAACNAPEGQIDHDSDSAGALLRLFKGWHEPIEDLIRASGSSILRNDIYDRDPIPSWSRGNATLLGDAAHPMTPDLGQGACQAIEDALELANSLRSSTNVASGLKTYEEKRIARTRSIVLASRQMGRLAQVDSPLLCGVRNIAFQLTPRAFSLRSLTPIVGYEKHLQS